MVLAVAKNNVLKYEDEVVYRKRSSRIECIHEFNQETGKRLRTTYFDYFDDKKVKSVEEYDQQTGKRIKSTSFVLFKSVHEYNPQTGKKVRTTNFDIRDENRITSIHEYNQEFGTISRVLVYRLDGKTLSMVKEFNPETEQIVRCINYKRNSNAISSISNYEIQNDRTVKTTYYYNPVTKHFTSRTQQEKPELHDIPNPVQEIDRAKIEKLIDNLFRNKLTFSSLSL